MTPPATPQFRKMPGSAITAVVLMWILAGLNALAGLAVLTIVPIVAALLLGGSAFSALIAVEVTRRRHWARVAGLVLYSVLIALQLLPILLTSATPTPQDSGNICLWFLPIPFLAMRNTRLWCDDSERRPSSFLSVDVLPDRQKALTVYDLVELVEDADHVGLRTGMVGMIVDVHTDPLLYEVEFDSPDDDTAVRAVLRPEQVRPTGSE